MQAERTRKQKNDSLYFTSYHQKRLQFTQHNITQLIADTTKQAASLRVHYNHFKRNLRLPVQAFKTRAVSLYTEGFTTIGKAKIMGKFYFDKVWDDSLANNLSGDLENGTPFTHFATKAGNYERQNINFEAGISYLILENLYLTSLLNYDYHWSTGSVDPRPDHKIFHLGYAPGLTYRLGKTVVGANYALGKVDGATDISYKNRVFTGSSLFPDRRLYINNGYGYIAQYTSEAFARSRDKIDGCGLSMATQLAKWQIRASYSNTFYSRKNFNLITNTDSVSNPIKEAVHSKYEMLTQHVQALIFNEKARSVHQISVDGTINEGTGQLMSSPGGANYLFDAHNMSLGYLLSLKKNQQVTAELGLDAGFSHFVKQDFLSQHFYENTTIHFSLKGGKYIYRKGHSFKLTAKPEVVFPLKNELSLPETQRNVFTQNVVYPEAYFRGATFFKGQIGVLYYTPFMLRIAGSALSLDLNYLKTLKNGRLEKEFFQPANQRQNQIHISVGFQIFL